MMGGRTVKKLISFLSAALMAVSVMCVIPRAEAATLDDINQSEVFLKQAEYDSCTLCAAVMLVRRVAIMRGDTDWQKITEAELKNVMDWEIGLSWDFTYDGIRIVHKGERYYLPEDTEEKKARLIRALASCPEGIVAYDRQYPHAVLLTDYTDGVFYCADPAGNAGEGRIPLENALVHLEDLDDFWYCCSPLVSLDIPLVLEHEETPAEPAEEEPPTEEPPEQPAEESPVEESPAEQPETAPLRMSDAVRLHRYLFCSGCAYYTEQDLAVVDLNGDGRLDARDLTLLKRELMLAESTSA